MNPFYPVQEKIRNRKWGSPWKGDSDNGQGNSLTEKSRGNIEEIKKTPRYQSMEKYIKSKHAQKKNLGI